LAGNGSLPRLASLFKYGQYQPHSVGYRSACFPTDGAALPSTLPMAEHNVVLYLREEMFARHQPLVVTMEAHGPAIVTRPLASEPSAEPWHAHCDDLGAHRFHRLGMASARGRGLVAGSHAACQDARWGCDRWPAGRDLFDRRRQLARTASAAMAKEDEAPPRFPHATSAAHLPTRLHHDAPAPHACAHARARYDPLALLLPLLHDAVHLWAPCGRLRTVAGGRSELTLLGRLIAASDAARRPTLLQPMRSPLDALFAPCGPAEALHAARLGLLPHPIGEALGLAWHHAPLSSPAPPQHKRSHQHESPQWLHGAAGLLAHPCALLQTWVVEKLDAVVHASALVALVKAFMRPSLQSSIGPITHEPFHRILFAQTHRRDKRGKRQGKAPMDLLPGAA